MIYQIPLQPEMSTNIEYFGCYNGIYKFLHLKLITQYCMYVEQSHLKSVSIKGF